MRSNITKLTLSTLACIAVAGLSAAHCQIPCGIYDDELRVQLIEEHITTLEKSMKKIHALAAAEGADDVNQATRWVINKEHHAQEIQDIVSAYFMIQRIKYPGSGEGDAYATYVQRLSILHRIQVAAMKAKQSSDLSHIATLNELVGQFRKAYFGDKSAHKH